MAASLGKTFYASNRKQWRSWLSKNHNKEKEIWLIYYRAATGKPRIPYDDAVEEALCYGWIDSIIRTIDNESFAQRFSPRKSTGSLSQPNKERVRKLIRQGKMTKAGLAAIAHVFEPIRDMKDKFIIPPDILTTPNKINPLLSLTPQPALSFTNPLLPVTLHSYSILRVKKQIDKISAPVNVTFYLSGDFQPG